jgi:hypothetical protein
MAAPVAPRKALRTNQMSRDATGAMWQYQPPNLVSVPASGGPPPDNGDGNGDNGPDTFAATQAQNDEGPARQEPREPEPEHHRRRRK